MGWGDRYKFRSLNSPVTMASGWDYSQPNTIPYVIEWANSPDAEMGLVQTQTYLQHDAGGYWFYDRWGTTDANGPMPEDYNWTYQLNQYELPSTTRSKRMAWGSNFGAVGQTSYLAYGDDKNLVGYPYQSYSVFVVLDKHSLGPVAQQVAEIETVQRTALSASVGTVVASGPAGIGRSDSVAYSRLATIRSIAPGTCGPTAATRPPSTSTWRRGRWRTRWSWSITTLPPRLLRVSWSTASAEPPMWATSPRWIPPISSSG